MRILICSCMIILHLSTNGELVLLLKPKKNPRFYCTLRRNRYFRGSSRKLILILHPREKNSYKNRAQF